jgi:hypothetical protein
LSGEGSFAVFTGKIYKYSVYLCKNAHNVNNVVLFNYYTIIVVLIECCMCNFAYGNGIWLEAFFKKSGFSYQFSKAEPEAT